MTRALVIGASGGIGGALAAALEARGARVDKLSRARSGFDVTQPDKADATLAALEGGYEQVFVAHGVLAPEGGRPEKKLAELSVEEMARVFAVNTFGVALVLKHMPRLLRRDQRALLAVLTARVGSIGDNHLGGWHSYRASKAATNQLVRGAAIELARSHPQAVCVALHPGTVATTFTENYAGKYERQSPGEAAQNLLRVVDGLTPNQTGQFFDWRGDPIPW